MLRVFLVVVLALASCEPESTTAPDQTRKGNLEKDVIRKIVRANLYRLRACYLGGLARDPDTHGRVTLQFTIGPTGAVTAANVVESEIADARVGTCIADVFEHMTFPPPANGGDIVITYPFVFEAEPDSAPKTGYLDEDVIREVVRSKQRFLRACYTVGLTVDRHARGRMTLRFTVGPSVDVTSVEVVDNEILDKEISECIADSTKRWRFPPPEGGGSVVVTYPFELDTESH